MSRKRCHSLDRLQQQRARNNFFTSGVYLPERSPHRSRLISNSRASLHHSPSTPNICIRHYGGANENRGINCIPTDDNIEFLEDVEEPPLYNLPPDSSFDEVMCVMATPPHSAQSKTPTAAGKLEELRAGVAAHIDIPKQSSAVQLDGVRQHTAKSATEPSLWPYKMPALPADPYAIPSPPKNPKDVAAIIRRAQVIARLMELENEKNALKLQKGTIKKSGRSVTVPKKSRKLSTFPTPNQVPVTKLLRSDRLQKVGAASKKVHRLTKLQDPPDYIPEDWAAAILRTRKLAGLKTSNPKLLPKSKIKMPKSLSQQPSPTPLKTSFENIMERISAVRSRTNAAKTTLEERNPEILTPRLQTESEELDEFEALEELYGTAEPKPYPPKQQSVSDIQSRINRLQQQIFTSPAHFEPIADAELDQFEALEQQYGAAPYSEISTPVNFASDLQDRIKTLNQQFLQSPSREQNAVSELPSIHRYEDLLQSQEGMEAVAAEIGLMRRSAATPTLPPTATPKSATSQRSHSPVASPQTLSQKWNNDFLQNIDLPEFDINEIPEFAFSAEAFEDAGFEIGDEVSLEQISMPDLDVSLDELGLEDVTAPDLCDLSISGNLELEPDYPIEISSEEEEDQVTENVMTGVIPEQPGILTSVVSAIVSRFKDMFSPSKLGDVQNLQEESELNLDTSLPNMFEKTPPQQPKKYLPTIEAQKSDERKPRSPIAPTVVPPHPKDPKDYKAMIKRAQAIQRKKKEQYATAEISAPLRIKKEKIQIKSSVPKVAPTVKKKALIQKEKSKKIYPPGEYSPSYVKAVARARALAGLRNESTLLNPEQAAKTAERKAAREAKLAAIEALSPVERMRKKMQSMRRGMGRMPRPSVEALATLEAIRANLPKFEPPKLKWRPAGRLRVDRHVKPSEKLFNQEFGRVLVPTEKTQKKKNWKKLEVMSPVAEETELKDDLIQFSPLKPHEGQMRIRYIKEQAKKRDLDAVRAAETETSPLFAKVSPRRFSPIRLHSPSSPRTEKTKREKVITKLGPHGGPETITEEVTEISTLENGEVHTSTRQIVTKTDEYGNVTRHIQDGKALSGEEEAIPEDLAEIEPPEFSDISDIPPPRDTSIPSPNEIISRIRSKVKEKLIHALSDIHQNSTEPSPASPELLQFPKNLPDEELFDIDIPEFERTPQETSTLFNTFSPVEKDQRMYAWREQPPTTTQLRTPISKISPSFTQSDQHVTPLTKAKSVEEIVYIPQHPKDPNDYVAMIKRAQAIQKLKNKEEKEIASQAKQVSKRLPRKRLFVKKRIPKKKLDYEDLEYPTEPPPLTQEYREAVARARLIHGLKNRTAALNPTIAAQLAAKKSAKEAYDVLPEIDKIKIRMEKLRKMPSKKPRFQPSADLLGALAAIRANIPPESVLSREVVPQTSASPNQVQSLSAAGYHTVPLPIATTTFPEDESLEEFEKLEAEFMSNASLQEFEAIEAENEKLYDEKPASIYYDPIQDFRVPAENVVLETSNLMLQTPPGNIRERLQRLKDVERKSKPPSDHEEQYAESPVSQAARYIPLRLESPRIAERKVIGDTDSLDIPISTPARNEWIFNIDETPKSRIRSVAQFKTLEDIPFDELEYEIEPSFTDISFEEVLSPPPRPEDIISKIRSIYHKKSKEAAERSSLSSPEMLKLPEVLTNEELLDISAPPFTQTPKTSPEKYKSPRISLPMAWGEVAPATPITPVIPSPRIPIKEPTPALPQVIERKILTPDSAIVIPPHPKDPKDYVAMVRRARAIYKLNKQKEAQTTTKAPSLPKSLEYRVPISRWKGPPPRKIGSKPKSKLVLRNRGKEITSAGIKKKLDAQLPFMKEHGTDSIAEPLPLTRDDRNAIAKARLLHGLKNRTAALNPKIAAKRAAQEAAVAAYNALPEIEKIKLRMERLRKKPHYRRRIKPTLEHVAYLEALKEMGDYQAYAQETLAKCPAPFPSPEKPGANSLLRSLSITPRAEMKKIADAESYALAELAEFEALEQLDEAPIGQPPIAQDLDLKQRIVDLKKQLLEAGEVEGHSLAEYGPLQASHGQQPLQSVTQLKTPQQIDPRERYRQLMTQRKTFQTPIVSPLKTPEVRYSPITLSSRTPREEPRQRAEKTTTQITRHGNNVIEEQIIETSEIVDGKLQHFKNLVTTTTDSQGKVTCQVNECKRVSARDRSAETESVEDIGDIQEPTFLDTTPLTPMERPRPRDIIERVRTQIKKRPEVPTGHLIELRTPPRVLPLPTQFPENELHDLSSPIFERTPPYSPVRSPVRSPDISIPQFFIATPKPSPVAPLKHSTPSPEGAAAIQPHPEDPKDFKTRATKIQQGIGQNMAERAAEVAAEKARAKKKQRVPISRWTGPPSRKPGKRRRLIMKKRGEVALTKEVEYPEESPTLPEYFAKEVALARKLAGLKFRTAALNHKEDASEAGAEAIRKEKNTEDVVALNAPARSPIKNYAEVLSRMKDIKEKGNFSRQPSLAAAAYLNALKGAMQVRQQPAYASPKTRYKKILAEKRIVPPVFEECPTSTPFREDVLYSPIRIASPIDLSQSKKQREINIAALEGIDQLEELSEFEPPSSMDGSQYQITECQYLPLTPPHTPPPIPAALISRIRQQYQQGNALVYPDNLMATPTPLEFPEELTAEDLFEQSAPSFSRSSVKTETPIMSPHISIPRYFEESVIPVEETEPVHKSIGLRSPTVAAMAREGNASSPPLLRVCPGINVKTPQGPVIVPSHPKDPTDVAAIIRRAQMIQKVLIKNAAENAGAAKAAKIRVPLSRRVTAKPIPKNLKIVRNLAHKQKEERECPMEPPELPAEYLAAVAKSRKLANLKTSALKSKDEVKVQKGATDYPDSGNVKPTSDKHTIATIMEKIAALRKTKRKLQGPTARELAHRQHLINRQQRKERKRILNELERLRQQQGFEFQPLKTPPTARERLEAIKSGITAATPTSVYPYSPVKTPQDVAIPQFQALELAQSPSYQFPENVSVTNIADMSMQLDDMDNQTLDYENTDEDLEFQLAEIANASYNEFGENFNAVGLGKADDFNIAKRIKMLHQELLESPERTDGNTLEEYNMAKRMRMLKKKLLRTPTQEDSHTKEAREGYDCVDISLLNEDGKNLDRQHLYDESIDDFEAMERECL